MEDHSEGEPGDYGQGTAGHQGHTDTGRGYSASDHALPGGLSIETNGLRLVPGDVHVGSGVTREWTYRVLDEAGSVVTDFEEIHDQLAHLILVRRDLTRFQHLHPRVDDGGTWSAEFSLPDPGVYRAFVDVLVGGQPTTLGVDLLASGPADYEAFPGTTRTAGIDRYELEMTPDVIPANEDVELAFAVRRDGDAVPLDPYLGALGHLVALRAGDLAYLHVHPEATDPEGGTVRFAARFPTPGRYRLYLQTKPEGELVTVSFDVTSGMP